MSGRIRCAVVGLGHSGQAHVRAIRACAEDFELAAVCDSAVTQAERIGREYGVAAFAELEEMLKRAAPELVAICTPSGLHAAQGIMAARHGCHVLSEKPLAVTLADAQALASACADAGVRLMVMMQLRLLPALQTLKRAIEEGRLGRIYFLQMNLFWSRPAHYYRQSSWRGTKTHDGGLFINQAIHYLDLMQWIMGKPELVQASAARLAHAMETPDTAAALLQWKNGAIGSLNVTTLAYSHNLETTLTILAEKGSVRWSFNPPEFKHWDIEGLPPPEAEAGFNAHEAYYRHAAKVVRNKEAPLVSGEDGIAALALAHAVHCVSGKGE